MLQRVWPLVINRFVVTSILYDPPCPITSPTRHFAQVELTEVKHAFGLAVTVAMPGQIALYDEVRARVRPAPVMP